MVDPNTASATLTASAPTLSYVLNVSMIIGGIFFALYQFFIKKDKNDEKDKEEIDRKRTELQQIYTELDAGRMKKIQELQEQINSMSAKVDEQSKKLEAQEIKIKSMVPFTELKDIHTKNMQLAESHFNDIKISLTEIKGLLQGNNTGTINISTGSTTTK